MHAIHFVRDVACAEFRDLVGNADESHRCRELVAQGTRRPHGCIATVRPTGDTDVIRADQTFFDQMLFEIDDIVEFLFGIIMLSQLRELHTTTGATAVVRVRNCIALGRQRM